MEPARHRGGRRSGFTLLEVTIAMAVLLTTMGGIFMVVEGSSRTYRTETVSAQLDVRARRALDRICAYLQAADYSSLTPPPVLAPASSTALDFQRARGFEAGEIVWGPTERLALEPDPGDADDGLDNDGDGSIDEGRVVWIENVGGADEQRIVLCSDVSEFLAGETAGNGPDDNGNGLTDERGLCFEYTGSRLIVRLSLEARDPQGNRIRCTVMRSATPRNTPEG
jgi:prepilin-type N-terminal cleavage/methylation domain-containing protein